jgi:membrane associated rhomboid family serine protease
LIAVNSAANDSALLPVWARPEAFPVAPGGWGWVDHKSRNHACDSTEKVLSVISEDRDAKVFLVWTPENPRMILPEELKGATSAVLTSRIRTAAADLTEAHDRLRWFGLMVGGLGLYLLYHVWLKAPETASPADLAMYFFQVLIHSMSMGIALLMFVIFAFIPWYQARKSLRDYQQWNADDVAAAVSVLRFETWLARQKAPFTRIMFALMLLVGMAQLLPSDSLRAAALVKPAYHAGEWWRLFTAPFLHGNFIHFLMNAAALLYLGKRMEVFARWPHVPMVFLFAACVGGEASARFVAADSVGASGGLMGWLGFLLVFESLHSHLVPRSSRRRLVAGVLLTALIGVLGYRFIDNAAHIGGLLAGMLYAVILFPKSTSAIRPKSTVPDLVGGSIAMAVLVAAAGFAVLRMVFSG